MTDADKDALFAEYGEHLARGAPINRRAFDLLIDHVYRTTRNRIQDNVRQALTAAEDNISVEKAVWHYTHQKETE